MTQNFSYQNQKLHAEKVSLEKIAQTVGTPTYVYSYNALRENYEAYAHAFRDFKTLICFSMKSNSNLSVLRSFIQLGSGIDIVSAGELFRALKAGADPRKIVFAGVGKTEAEMAYALQKKILMFNIECEQELELLDRVAQRLKKRAPIALRVNPDIDPKTHPYITTGMKQSKFGIQYEHAFDVYREAKQRKGIEVIGIDCHIGSQLTELNPFLEALQRILLLVKKLEAEKIDIRYLDLGGGLGIRYQDEKPPTPAQYAQALKKILPKKDLTLIFEPGRSLVGNAGVLLTQVLYNKERDHKSFVIVDAAMNDLIRPAFYESYHEILPLRQKRSSKKIVDVVGPVCESGDFLAKDRPLPPAQPGDLYACMSAGAYGFAMASNYNARPRACEVLVRGNRFHVIRRRETFADLVRGEEIPDFLEN